MYGLRGVPCSIGPGFTFFAPESGDGSIGL